MPVPRSCAVFLDRDGVLIEDVDYVRSMRQVHVVPGAPEAVARLNKAGLRVVVVSNQSGVARGYFSLRTLQRINAALKRRLREAGARLDGLYYCPHLPPAKGRKPCGCRKPGTGLVERARRRWGIDLSRSFFVGDSTTDLQTARNAGCKAVLVRTGKAGKDGRYRVRPDAACPDLPKAVDWILGVLHGS
ncbi:MAG: HAD family hydrolase [Elusimicrobia bacterium]|nr:HAD family hydrolase [Elusimicrobiota bacterium]